MDLNNENKIDRKIKLNEKELKEMSELVDIDAINKEEFFKLDEEFHTDFDERIDGYDEISNYDGDEEGFIECEDYTVNKEPKVIEFYTEEEKQEVAEKNLKLVNYVIKIMNIQNVEHDELFSVGLMGFAKAINSFDKNNKAKFGTYATTCIRNEISFFLRKDTKHKSNTTSINKTLSVDKNGNDLKLEDIISDEELGLKNLEEKIVDNENRAILLKAIKYLDKDEQFIITYRFGLDRGIIFTQKEIAKKIKMSQANVSKKEKLCLDKLKLLLRKDMLK